MKIIIFFSENGLDCSDVFQADTTEQLDKATYEYLKSIGDFAWDENSTQLQNQVKLGEYDKIWNTFSNMLRHGYNCFMLDESTPYAFKNIAVNLTV